MNSVAIVRKLKLLRFGKILFMVLATLSIITLFLSIINSQLIVGCFSFCVLALSFFINSFIKKLNPQTLKFIN
mgnify:CR=1 FL=1